MHDDPGKSYTPLVASVITFLLLGTVVFFAVGYLFADIETEFIVLEKIGQTISVSQLVLTTGIAFVLAFSLIIHFVLLINTEGQGFVDRRTRALLKSRDFFLRLFDDSPVPYLMVDGEGTITLPNKAAQRLFNQDAEELLKYKFYQLHDDAHLVESRQILEKFTRGVATLDVELEVKRNNGKSRWVILSAVPFKVMGGVGKGGVITMLDITEQKSIDRVKTEFVSLASHQLRTPLTAMKWYGEMILNGNDPLTAKQRTQLEKIYKGNERMIELVNLLLSASRLELGTLTVDITNVDPIAIIKTNLDDLSRQIKERGIQIVEQYEGDAENYYTDSKLATMILQNLLSNAVKYTRDNGFVKINITFSNEKMVAQIEDNGVGIPLGQQEKVFSKMFRADNARLSDTEGTGLGLYIVKEAVEALRGEIRFTSTENEGTMFEVVLPNGTHGNTTKDAKEK